MRAVKFLHGLALAVTLFAAASAHAWNRAGHRVAGIIAYRQLMASSPQTVARIVEIMQSHPEAATFARRMRDAGSLAGNSANAQHERLFAEMAQWPDEIRLLPLHTHNHNAWHVIGIPWVPEGVSLSTPPTPPPPENLLWAFRENLRIVQDPAASDAERAVALCWIFHLAGDLHQPLHTISLFSPVFPRGDRYGTRFWVREDRVQNAITLHVFWDRLIILSSTTDKTRAAASRLMAANSIESFAQMRQRPFVNADSIERWGREESHELAISDAYLSGKLPGSERPEDAPILDESYIQHARVVAERQFTLSAYRLAEILKKVVPR